MASQFILMEIVREMARQSKDPPAFLAAMFERISARMDQGPLEREKKAAVAAMRESLATFFAKAGYRIGAPESPKA